MTTTRTIDTKNCTVRFEDGPEAHKRVFDAVVAFFVEHECFSGESYVQCDDPQIGSLPFMCDLLDDVIQFQQEWK